MKHYIVSERNLVAIDLDDVEKTEVISYNSTAIDYLWIAPYDGIVEGTEVKEGDLIVRLYGRGDQQPKTIVLKDPAFSEHVKTYNNYLRKDISEDACDCNSCKPSY